jgi:uncharacterized protein
LPVTSLYPMKKSHQLDLEELSPLLLCPPQSYVGNCPDGAEDVPVKINENVVLSCRFYPAAPEAATLIYFHGGCESTDSFDAEAALFIQAGINVFLSSYRGFGKSSGVPQLTAVIEDAEIQYEQAREWLKGKGFSGAVIVMGRSLGSVCAVHVVAQHQESIKAMILESAFSENLLLPKTNGLEENTVLFEFNNFNTLEKISTIKVPTLIFHGARDMLVPVSQVEKLQSASAAKNKQFLLIPGADHYSVSKTGGNLFYKTIKGFIDSVCGVNTWRQRRKTFKAGVEGEKT